MEKSLMEIQKIVKKGGDALKQLNQEVADYLDSLQLSREVRDVIADTDINSMAEVFGGLHSEKEVEEFVTENYL